AGADGIDRTMATASHVEWIAPGGGESQRRPPGVELGRALAARRAEAAVAVLGGEQVSGGTRRARGWGRGADPGEQEECERHRRQRRRPESRAPGHLHTFAEALQ